MRRCAQSPPHGLPESANVVVCHITSAAIPGTLKSDVGRTSGGRPYIRLLVAHSAPPKPPPPRGTTLGPAELNILTCSFPTFLLAGDYVTSSHVTPTVESLCNVMTKATGSGWKECWNGIPRDCKCRLLVTTCVYCTVAPPHHICVASLGDTLDPGPVCNYRLCSAERF